MVCFSRRYPYQSTTYFIMPSWVTCRINRSTTYFLLSVRGDSVRVRGSFPNAMSSLLSRRWLRLMPGAPVGRPILIAFSMPYSGIVRVVPGTVVILYGPTLGALPCFTKQLQLYRSWRRGQRAAADLRRRTDLSQMPDTSRHSGQGLFLYRPCAVGIDLSMAFFRVSLRVSKWSRNTRGGTSRYMSERRIFLGRTIDSEGCCRDRIKLKGEVLDDLRTCVLYA